MNWDDLKNPVFARDGWSVKDACMACKDGTFHLFFSAFYRERWRERSHVVGVITHDFRKFSEPVLHLDGREDKWTGMCSPNISIMNERYYLTFNSWGDRHRNRRKNQLFCMESDDMISWTEPYQVAGNITEGFRAIDLAVTRANGKFYAIWKEDYPDEGRMVRKPLIASGPALDGNLELLDGHGKPTFTMADGKRSTKIQENFEFLEVDGRWYLLSLDYRPHVPVLYEMDGAGSNDADWLNWVNGRELEIEVQSFNTNHAANAPFIADWREHDGYFYMIYAGRTEGISHKGRGNNKLGLARSKDLMEWEVPPERSG